MHHRLAILGLIDWWSLVLKQLIMSPRTSYSKLCNAVVWPNFNIYRLDYYAKVPAPSEKPCKEYVMIILQWLFNLTQHKPAAHRNVCTATATFGSYTGTATSSASFTSRTPLLEFLRAAVGLIRWCVRVSCFDVEQYSKGCLTCACRIIGERTC